MLFLKINDSDKRDFIVKEYLQTKRNIQQNFLSDRLDNIHTQREMAKFLKPVIDTQKDLKESFINEVKDLKENIQEIPTTLKAINFPQFPSIKAVEDAEDATEKPSLMKLDSIATEYLKKFTAKSNVVDKTFGLYDKDGKFYIGNTEVDIEGNNIIVGDKEYEGTPGLWELIVHKEPDSQIYSQQDFKDYAEIMLKTNAIKQNHDPNTLKVKSSKGNKWKEILKPIWENRRQYEGKGMTTVIPSDPNVLAERLELLLASKGAGNTGVRNELISVCDELLRQKVIDRESYKKLMMVI
jgi:hypothetical protein